MMSRFHALGTFLAVLLVSIPTAPRAASLSIAPVGMEVIAPGAAASLTLRNDGPRPLTAQVRVFRWSQVNGEERLVPSEDVVASPPLVSLQPGLDYTVRVVRVSKRAISGEESYRLLVDELPDSTPYVGRSIRMVLRYSVPVFFANADSAAAKLDWRLVRRRGRTFLVVNNAGDRRVRISRLRIRDPKGVTISLGEGLVGYALGRSSMQWLVPAATRLSATGTVTISAESDRGPVTAVASISEAR